MRLADQPRARWPDRDVVVIGGCGHVGLPLAIAFADRGARVAIYDVSEDAVGAGQRGPDAVRRAGRRGGAAPGARGGAAGGHRPIPPIVAGAEHVVVVIGTPVDEHLNPDQTGNPQGAERAAAGHLRDGQILILRSTVYPGVTALVEKIVAGLGLDIDVAFCPERIAEGQAMTELFELPQIVASRTPAWLPARERPVRQLLTSTHRRDVAGRGRAGQAVHQRLALHQVRHRQPALHDGQRPRAGLRADPARPGRRTTRAPRTCRAAGFAAGPCLFKDTMQLAAFNNNNFALGHAAMAINEGLPLYLVHRLEQRFDLAHDDRRASSAWRSRRGSDDIRSEPVLQAQADPVVQGRRRCCAPTRYVHRRSRPAARWKTCSPASDLLIIAAPHPEYRALATDKPGGRHLERARQRGAGCDQQRRHGYAGLGGHPRLQRG